jgi:large subunit ribosomal protein L10
MRKEKQYLLDEIHSQIQDNSTFVLISYKGLDANLVNGFRTDILKLKGGVEFVKKRILVKAAEKLGVTLQLDTLPGHIGLVLTKHDPIEITKEVFKFQSGNKEKVDVVGGRIEGAVVNGDQMKVLSELPSKDEMRAQLLAVLEAPLSQTLSTMEALITSVVYCLDNKVKQSEEN